MRVAVDALAVSPRRPGGDVSYVRALARWLPRVAPEDEWLFYVTPFAGDLFPEPVTNARYAICPLPSDSLPLRVLWEQTLLAKRVVMSAADVLFAPVNVAPLTARLSTVLTLHEAEPFMPGTRIPVPLRAWWRVARSISARRARAILTVSRSARADISRWMRLPCERIDVAHLGVDLERFTPNGAEPHPLGGRPYCLWVGRPYPRKNLVRLVEAFAEIRRAGREEVLVLAGPRGWNEAEIAATMRARGLQDAVIRRPSLTADLPAWLRHAATFVFPSTHETFGLPILEAMACGAPVVAADIPSLREVGGDVPVWADPLSPDALADALLAALTDPSVAERARSTGPAHARLFPWSRTASTTARVLRRAASCGSR